MWYEITVLNQDLGLCGGRYWWVLSLTHLSLPNSKLDDESD